MKIKCYGIKCRLFKQFKIRRFYGNTEMSFPNCKEVDNIGGFVNLKDGVYSIVAGRSVRSYYAVYENKMYFLFDSFVEYSKQHYVTQGHSDLRQVKDFYLTTTSVAIKTEQKRRSKEYEDEFYKRRLYFTENDFTIRLRNYKANKKIKILIGK
jgi:hypothetical protein